VLGSHFDAVERRLLSESGSASNSGHPVHKGTLRENFVREFLRDHLGQSVAISEASSEIIDAQSRPGELRPQIDVVIYRPDFPRLTFGPGVTGFLAESVLATIEVKSTLTKKELKSAVVTGRRLKSLQQNISYSLQFGVQPASILTYVVAYKGPTKMKTVYSWLNSIHQELGIPPPQFGAIPSERHKVPSPAIDGVWILGRGFIRFANVPTQTLEALPLPDSVREGIHNIKWIVRESETGNLLWLFTILNEYARSFSLSRVDLSPYIRAQNLGAISVGP
jgi:hypothetical protein